MARRVRKSNTSDINLTRWVYEGVHLTKIIKFPKKRSDQKKFESAWACSGVCLAKIIEFPQKSPDRKNFEKVLNRLFSSGEVPEELLDELWHYTLGIVDKFESLRSSLILPLPDILSEKDSAVISAAARNSVDLFIDKGYVIFKEMLREIILLRLALHKAKVTL